MRDVLRECRERVIVGRLEVDSAAAFESWVQPQWLLDRRGEHGRRCRYVRFDESGVQRGDGFVARVMEVGDQTTVADCGARREGAWNEEKGRSRSGRPGACLFNGSNR